MLHASRTNIISPRPDWVAQSPIDNQGLTARMLRFMSVTVGLLLLLSAGPIGLTAGDEPVSLYKPAVLTSFEWQSIDSPQYAGESIDVVILAMDDSGNSYPLNGIALLSTTLGDQFVYPSYVQFNDGICNSRVVVTIAESLALRCSRDTVSGTSEVFEVLPGAPKRLMVILPGEQLTPGLTGGRAGSPDEQTAGDSFSFEVYRTDGWFNQVDQSNDSVELDSDNRFDRLPAGGRLPNGTGSFPIVMHAAGERHITAKLARSLLEDISSPVTVRPGPYKNMLLIAPGEVLMPGDTSPLESLPGKEGTPSPQYLREPFGVNVYACDSFWNPRDGLGDTVFVRSDVKDSCTPSANELTDSVRFSFQFNQRGENRPLWVRDSLTGAESYITYLDVRARGASLSAIAPDTVRSGETAQVLIRVVDVHGEQIPAALVRTSVVKGTGTMIEPELLTDTAGYATAHFVCTPSPASEQDSIRITSDNAIAVIGIYVKHLSDSLFAFPNPFGSINQDRTLIFYSLQKAVSVKVRIYDPFGNRVWTRSFSQGEPGAQFGDNTIYWDGTNNKGKRVASGIYVIQVLGTTTTSIDFRSLYRVGVVW